MLFGEGQSQEMLGDCGETESFQSQQTRRDFGVEQALRSHAEVRESRKVLQGVVQDPYRVADRAVEIVPIGSRGRKRLGVEQSYAGAVAFELHQPVLVTVSESRCAFRVRREGAVGGSQSTAVFAERGQCVDHIRHAFTWFRLQLWLIDQRKRPPRIVSWIGGMPPTVRLGSRRRDLHRHSLMESKTRGPRIPPSERPDRVRRPCCVRR